jgi:hypothetical protein
VDKRSKQDVEQNEQLVQALMCEGFGVTPDILSKYKEASQSLTSQEIPVDNSASTLKAAAGKDLSRILKLYMETLQQQKASSSSSNSRVQMRRRPTNNNWDKRNRGVPTWWARNQSSSSPRV